MNETSRKRDSRKSDVSALTKHTHTQPRTRLEDLERQKLTTRNGAEHLLVVFDVTVWSRARRANARRQH